MGRELVMRVHAAVAPMQVEPRAGSEQVSQSLAGHLLVLLEERGDWFLVRGEDGYEGWMHRGYVRAASPDEAPWADARLSLGCVVRSAQGGRLALPLGALLSSDAVLLRGRSCPVADRPARFPARPALAAGSAVRFFEGTPYQWGGVTPWGADCSGMVQSVFGLHGIRLPRDAWQQAECGSDAGADLSNLRGGDLLFFSDRDDGRITHVAIAVGRSGRIVHLALGRGGYAVDDLSDEADPYVTALRARFRFARRVRAGTTSDE